MTEGTRTTSCTVEISTQGGGEVAQGTKTICNAKATQKAPKANHTWNQTWESDGTYHWHKCTTSGCTATDTKAAHTPVNNATYTWNDSSTHKYKCLVCSSENALADHSWTYKPSETDSTKHIKYCSICSSETDSASGHVTLESHDFNGTKCTKCNAVDPSKDYTISISNRYEDTIVVGDYTELTATVKNANNETVTPDGKVTWTSSSDSIATVDKDGYVTAKKAGNVTITATCTPVENGGTISATYKLTVSDARINVTATVSGSYFLGDADDNTRYSVWEKIENDLGKYYDLLAVKFDNVTSEYGDLDAVRREEYNEDKFGAIEFVPEEKGKAIFKFTAYYENSNGKELDDDGVLTIEVKDTASSSKGDITYTAELGEDFYFEVSDFEDFWEDKYPDGTLDHVIFNSASNGSVKGYRTTVSYDKDKFYVDPGKNEDDLADVYFSPSSSRKAMTAKVNFTAYGSKKGSSGSSYDRAGTITIYYLNDSASDITYSTTNGKVTLDPKDFEDAYKEATGSKTAPSNLTIEFQNVPTNGTLTYTGGSKDKDLTKSNVKSTRYTTKSSGSNRLAQLTYSGTKGKDTIDYIAYSGGTAQFSGKVVFNGAPAVPTDVVVGPFYSTAGQPAAFSQNTFTAASSAISNAVKVRFVAPANGTLTMSGASAAGTDIAVSLLNLVSYQPRAGYNGTDQIIFAAYDAKNAVVASGTVNVQVIGNPTTTTPTTPGGSTGGVTDVSQFKDVASGAWYRDNLATLVKKGVISGRGDGKFDPKGTVTYGEALKMVLEACGYTAAVGTGSQWAINYKNLAVSRGWISNDIDLNAAISRNATAELAAKVLGVSPVTSGSPFADDANAYAVALYYTTPQIFVGTTNPNGGKPLFENNKALLREQVCAVICRVMDYHTQHTTNTMPDGT